MTKAKETLIQRLETLTDKTGLFTMLKNASGLQKTKTEIIIITITIIEGTPAALETARQLQEYCQPSSLSFCQERQGRTLSRVIATTW